MPAAMLDGMRGVVDATPDGKIVYSGVGLIAVTLKRGTKAVLFENLLVVPPTEAEEKRSKKAYAPHIQCGRTQALVAKKEEAKKAAGGSGDTSAGGGGVLAASN
jgi:hypothetical protein